LRLEKINYLTSFGDDDKNEAVISYISAIPTFTILSWPFLLFA
jgi:hypothetical protein